MSYDYRVTVPASERALFRQIAKKMGWGYTPVRKRSGIEEAMEDIAVGRVRHYASVEDMMAQVLG